MRRWSWRRRRGLRSSGILQNVRANRIRRRGRDAACERAAAASPSEPPLWLFHVSALEGEAIGGLQFETDRARFLGRGHDLRNAVSIMDARPLSNTAGTVLDPVLALRRRVRIAPGETARIAFWSGVAGSRAQALALADKHRDIAAFDRDQDAGAEPSPSAAARFGRGLRRGAAISAHRQPGAVRRFVAARPARDSRQESVWAPRRCGPSAFPAICPSCWCESMMKATSKSSSSCCARTSTGGSSALAVDLVILNDHPRSGAAELQQALDAAIAASQARSRGAGGLEAAAACSRFAATPCRPSSRELLQTAARAIFTRDWAS